MSKGLPKHAYALKAGHKLGLYRVVRPLGAGGMGEVYLVEHVHMNKQYALKLLPADLAGDGEFIDRFRIEARVMADLEHPHIVRVHNFGEEDGVYYLIMDYVEGPDGAPRTLEDELAWARRCRIARSRRLPCRSATRCRMRMPSRARGWCIGISSRRTC